MGLMKKMVTHLFIITYFACLTVSMVFIKLYDYVAVLPPAKYCFVDLWFPESIYLPFPINMSQT